MTEFRKHAVLLSVMGLLVLAKFILVPVFDWQASQLVNIQSLQKKQNKTVMALSNQKDNETLSTKITQTLSKTNSIFFPFQTESAFKLTQQKMLESMLDEHQIKFQNFGWQITTNLSELSVLRYQLQISFSGKTIDIIQFIKSLEVNRNLIEVSDFNISLKGQHEEFLGRASGRIDLFLYMTSESIDDGNSMASEGVTL